jgi:tetratricopeptide (TPR) repeat protein
VLALCIGCASANSASSYTRQGYALWHRGEYNAAITAFDNALKADPGDAEAYYGRGAAHEDAGQYDAAIADYTSAIQLEPRGFDYENRGVSYEFAGRWAPALADYSEAIKLEPQSASLYVRRASLYARAGDVQMAKTDLDKAAGIAGAAPSLDYLLYYSWILATSPSPQIRNGSTAVRYAAEASDMTNNNSAWILDNLAAAYAENGQFDEAIEWQKKSCELTQQVPDPPVIILRHRKERLALYEKHQPYRESQATLAH